VAVDTDARRPAEDREASPGLVSTVTIRPRESALVVFDMQTYALREDIGLGAIVWAEYPERAKYYFDRVRALVIPNITKMIRFYRDRHLRVVYVTGGPELPDASDYFPRRRLRDRSRKRSQSTLFPRGTPEHEIIEELAPVAGELVVNKTSTSPFNSTGIDQLLRNMGITGLVMTGVGTLDVETMARDAADRGYDVYMIEDACASLHPKLHDTSLEVFRLLFGSVKTTDEALTEFRSALG
jgi:nicotinamidase-related amidase